MATTPSQKNPAVIAKNFKNKIIQRTNINNFDRDSKVKAITNALQEELIELRNASINSFQAAQLSNSSGEDLIRLAENHGVEILNQSFATVLDVELNQAFYVETGTFGDINSGASITIPAGKVISSLPNNNELGATVRYKLTKAVVAPADASIVYVSARAEISGDISNVGQGVLTQHNVTEYTDSATKALKTINFYPILNGRRAETDSQLKFRVAQNYNRLHQNSSTKILLNSLQVPGVLQVKNIPGYFGIGTVGVVVLGANNQSNPALINQVQARLDKYEGPAGQMIAVPAAETSFILELNIRTIRNLNPNEKARLKSQIKRACINYFRSVGIGGIVRLEELAQAIQTNSAGLISLNVVGDTNKLFKKVYIARGFSNSVYSEREELINTTHVLDADEYADLNNTLTINFI